VTFALVRPFFAPATVLDAWATLGLLVHCDSVVILMAYSPEPPASDLLFFQVLPHPLALPVIWCVS